MAQASEMAVGSMKMVKVGDRRLVLLHTSTGFHALDNACPHEGYGLVQGGLDGELLTCEWHNWKFDVSNGACVLGEEAVTSHAVSVVDNDVIVTVHEPSPAAIRASAATSLDRGIDAQYNGQIARDSLRLLHAGATPVDVLLQAIARIAPRTEEGFTHALAMTADCLAAAAEMSGDDQLTPVAQAVAGMAESELRRPVRPRPVPLSGASVNDEGRAQYRSHVEAERESQADALLTGALLSGLSRQDAIRWTLRPVCDHHLAFGHGAIYVQKAFELLDHVGWAHAADLLAQLTTMHVYSTREDKLPYMRSFLKAVAGSSFDSKWQRPVDDSWAGRQRLVEVLLGADQVAAVGAAMDALDEGAGIVGILDSVSIAAGQRMLRHDLSFEQHPDVSGYGWLDITHSLTYANAARWAWTADPGEHTARLAMYTVFHVVDGGRYATIDETPAVGRAEISLDEAMATGAPSAAVAAALAEPGAAVADALVR
ncbi:MAG: Rieske 2Fe-2S domain-containing protein, partial [Ilumatobacteraceae bacterium]